MLTIFRPSPPQASASSDGDNWKIFIKVVTSQIMPAWHQELTVSGNAWKPERLAIKRIQLEATIKANLDKPVEPALMRHFNQSSDQQRFVIGLTPPSRHRRCWQSANGFLELTSVTVDLKQFGSALWTSTNKDIRFLNKHQRGNACRGLGREALVGSVLRCDRQMLTAEASVQQAAALFSAVVRSK